MHTLITSDGLKLYLHRWPAAGPARGTVQIVHGLGEHMGRYARLATELNSAGWDVVGHDQRGHGRSEGPRGDIAKSYNLLSDLAGVMDHARNGRPHVLLGHSMGGEVAARFASEMLVTGAARWAREVSGLVLSSPALDPGLGWFRRGMLAALGKVAPNFGVSNGLKPKWLSHDPAVVQAYVKDPLNHRRITPKLARSILEGGTLVMQRAPRWRVPTLLLWGGADRIVNPAGSAAFAAAAPPGVVTAVEFPTLYHEIFNEPERAEVLTHLTGWLQRF